ncbi:alpha-aminoadipic semialdehyde synthase, mitochondrial isoform X1 [Procambarus clarkii]|uniref:alpha-aminoadipic semialdehyde synthase, mitochondrial isoform X1 n=2 Tax=Procambarus clarkii TaxID=6728 RepID=UPI001E67301A|nr:alpha-aminoadipic semialdehyde synthase, mitochondrial-like isoform X2 [Procambarus clarkii]
MVAVLSAGPLLARCLPSSRALARRWISRNVRGRILGIRREDQSVWERRAPLGPSQVRQLVKNGVKVIVQPSNRRAYPMQAYQNVGAKVQEDLSEAPVIIGVKQVPIDQLIPNRTYCFFSHTIKAQEANMPLLDAILEKNIRLIDYERMCDRQGQRVVAFGKYAGVAGMINVLNGLGLRLLALGHHTPFMHIGPAHNYRNTEMARQSIRDTGYEISLGMMPNSIGPLTFIFTGTGNVSQGAQEIVQELPHEYVSVKALKKVAEHGSTSKIYCCEVSRRDHLVKKDGGKYDAVEYEEHPERYISVFAHKVAPYASVIINGIYWALNSPKLLTIPDAKYLLQPVYTPWLPTSRGSPSLPHRMLAICDISADPGGSIEFMTECTTIDTPFCLYDADQNKDTKSFKGPGVLVCSIDNMPTQLPREATDSFGSLLLPHMYDILQSDASKPFEEQSFTHEVHGAVITSGGRLTENFEYIADLRAQSRATSKSAVDMASKEHKVLVLGAGYVSAPLVEYLSRNSNTGIIVASDLQDEADALASKHPNVESVLLDVVERPDLLEDLVRGADVVVSLLPYMLHHVIAKHCIQQKTNLVTASYCTAEMQELHQAAADAGVTMVNEVGLDPGIDHLFAMECFEEVQRGGGKIDSFVSYCGGLPAPEFSDNPLRYKFSWSPRGVLINTLSGAKYIEEGQVVEIPPGGTLLDSTKDFTFLPGLALEGFPNRDSTVYRSLYGIPEAKTVLRGTLRFRGFSEVVKGLQRIGLIDPEPHPMLHRGGPDITWRQLLCSLLGQMDSNIFYDNLKTLVLERVDNENQLNSIEALGLLKDDQVHKAGTPLDTLSHYLSKRLELGPGERDLIVLRHEIGITWPDGRKELKGINLVTYGDPNGYSAMAKTVGYPTAIATKMVLDGEIQGNGMVLPFTRDIYKPLITRLQNEGITATEKSTWF